MAENSETLKCPLCEGHGTVHRKEVPTRLANAAWIQDQLQQAAEPQLVAAGNLVRDFQKEVHTWNPELPMWRRSNKE